MWAVATHEVKGSKFRHIEMLHFVFFPLVVQYTYRKGASSLLYCFVQSDIHNNNAKRCSTDCMIFLFLIRILLALVYYSC